MDDSLIMVKEILANHHLHHLLVVNDEKELCGLISDRDLLRVMPPSFGGIVETEKDRQAMNIRAHQIMVRNLKVLKSTAGIYDAVELFLNADISSIPIVNDAEKIIGLVTIKDVLKLMIKAKYIHNKN
jgi:acetoin utilization protein AcuB